MNNVLKVGMALALLIVVPCLGNPLPPVEVESVHAYPPQIGLTCYAPSVDISGRLIIIDSDTAVINAGTIAHGNWPSGDPFILDSSNTSGFTINPEGGEVTVYLMSSEWGDGVSYGQKGYSSAIIEGHYIKKMTAHMDYIPSIFTYEFAQAYPGWTKVVINEVNAGGTWNRCGNFVELYNRSNNPISLASWKLINDTIYSFPPDAVILGHGYYVIDECDLPANFRMRSGGDNIYLLKGDSLVDQVGWSSNHGADISFMRYPDGDADTLWHTDYIGYNDSTSSSFEDGFPSRGAANRYDCPGFVVIAARADSVDLNSAHLTWTNPLWDQDFATAVIVKSTTGYANNPADGEIIYEGIGQTYLDVNLNYNQTYYYTIFARKFDNSYSTPTSESYTSIILHSAGINEITNLPSDFEISCYPNPFNAKAKISFTLTKSEKVSVAIYDISGRLVDIVADGFFDAGQNSVIWDATKKPSGVYFYSVKTEIGAQTKSVVLMK